MISRESSSERAARPGTNSPATGDRPRPALLRALRSYWVLSLIVVFSCVAGAACDPLQLDAEARRHAITSRPTPSSSWRGARRRAPTSRSASRTRRAAATQLRPVPRHPLQCGRGDLAQRAGAVPRRAAAGRLPVPDAGQGLDRRESHGARRESPRPACSRSDRRSRSSSPTRPCRCPASVCARA